MYVDYTTIIAAASLLGAMAAIVAAVYRIMGWFQAQGQQTEDIGELRDEACLLTYAVLACLKGLQEQGCNGPVTEAIGKVERHINQKAHGQKD